VLLFAKHHGQKQTQMAEYIIMLQILFLTVNYLNTQDIGKLLRMKNTPRVGSFIEISLGKNLNAYARVIGKNLFSFYKIEHVDGAKSKDEVVEIIRNSDPIFSIYIHKNAFGGDNWRIIGHLPLEQKTLNNMPVFFRQDIVNKDTCWLITVNLGPDYKKPLAKEECINMEREASWDNIEHIEERLRDYLANKPNIWVERLRVKL